MHMKHCPRILTLLLPLLAAGILPVPCAASTASDKSDLILFVSSTDLPPYFINDSGHPASGILPDVLRAVAGPLGYTFKIEVLPNKRGWEMLKRGEMDVHVFAREWADQPDRFLWTDPFLDNEDVLLCSAKREFGYTRPEDLYGRAVAAMKGFVYPALEPHFGPDKITRVDTSSPDNMFKLLLLDRVDAALVNRAETQWIFRNRPDIRPELFRMAKNPFDRAWYRFVFPRGHGWESVIRQFDQRIETMKRDGSLEAILDQYR